MCHLSRTRDTGYALPALRQTGILTQPSATLQRLAEAGSGVLWLDNASPIAFPYPHTCIAVDHRFLRWYIIAGGSRIREPLWLRIAGSDAAWCRKHQFLRLLMRNVLSYQDANRR